MSKELTLRAIRPEDAALLTKLHLQCFPMSPWSYEQIKGSLDLPTTRGFLALEDGEGSGFILSQNVEGHSEILTFCVLPEARRQNIGLSLLGSMIDEASTSGSKKIYLEVASDNNAACQLYHKLGFVISGKRPKYYKIDNLLVDALLFELNL